MRKEIWIFIIFIIGIYCTPCNAEYTAKQYTQIPPSPEVASLMKYIDVPVSHFTGLPQINIQLYTLTEGSLSIPISLSYHGGGIKQNELPGIISKGWTLNAGMTISRSVYGLPDDYNYNKGQSNEIKGLFHLTDTDKTLRNKVINYTGDYDPSSPNSNTAFSVTQCSDYEDGYLDFANDIFKFSGLGMSGTFVFDENQNMTLSTNSPVKFNSQKWKPFDYEIIDKNQTKYIFGIDGIEESKIQKNASGYLEEDSLLYISAWHITKIRSLYGDSIEFIYSDYLNRNEHIGYTQSRNFYSNPSSSSSQKTNSIRATYLERNLLEIRSKSAKIKFHYSSDNKQLNSITIHRADNAKILHYEIVRSTNGDMTQIQQVAGSTIQSLYQFSYIDKTCTEPFSIDHWGYCNGASNSTLLPDIGYTTLVYDKANRSPEPNHAKEGVLTQIKYPMGGTTTLNWEQNYYSYTKGELLESETIVTETQSTQYLKGKTFNERLVVNANAMNKDDTIRLNLNTYFKSLVSSTGGIDSNAFLTAYNSSNHSNDNNYPCVKIILMTSTGEELKGTYYLDYKCETDSIKAYSITTAGNYKIELCNPRSFEGVEESDINGYFGNGAESLEGDYGYIPVTLIRKTSTQTATSKPWGGLRIASITSSPEIGNSITKSYSYRKTVDDKSYSSGHIAMEPNYKSQMYRCIRDPQVVGYQESEVIIINSDGLYQSTDGELNIEYEEVWERYSGGANFKIGYFYDTHSRFPDRYISNANCIDYVGHSQKKYTSYAFKRGNLKEKQYICNDSLIYKKETYDYNITELENTPIFSGTLYTLCNFIDGSISDNNGSEFYKSYTIGKYSLIPYNKRIHKESVWEKGMHEKAESERDVLFTYYGDNGGYNENPWNSFVKSKSYVNSKGETVTTYYTYYKIGNIPIDQTEYEITVINGTIVSARRMEYDAVNNRLKRTYTGAIGSNLSSNFSLPTHATGTASGLPSLNNLEYSYEYDSNGNIVQISYNGKVLASYLWGYLGKHPIVEVQGMTYSELFSIASSYGYTDGFYLSNMQQFLTSLRADNRLTGKEVLTYTYHWLLGMATSTDSRGIKNTYLLDGFGRLSGVKDNNGYYISKYDYNYKGF